MSAAANESNGRTPVQQRALVIVPTFNERDNILEVVERLMAAGDDLDVLFVDDASPDGTSALIEQLALSEERIHLLCRPRKMGLGTAYVTGFGWGLEQGYSALVEMDADLSHDPADVPRLLGALERADLTIGSRYVPGGGVENWGRLRRALSRSANLYARWMLGFEVRDSTSGFRAFRPATLERIDYGNLVTEGYGFQIETTRRVRLRGGLIEELPIVFVERVRGRSKMTFRIVVEALVAVARWAISDRLARRPPTPP